MQYNTTRYVDENQDNETLKDMTKSGKQRPWREKKIDNVSYADILEILKIKKAFNVKQCGNVLEFKPTDEGYLKLHKTWFCKSKLCPVCNWRRAMKNSYQAQKVIEEVVKEKPKARWLFLTLSARNAIDGEHLEQSLKHMTKAFNKLKMYTKVKKNLIGFLRSTEVTWFRPWTGRTGSKTRRATAGGCITILKTAFVSNGRILPRTFMRAPRHSAAFRR